LSTNLTDNDPALLWQRSIHLVAVEEVVKDLEDDLAIRPIFHKDESGSKLASSLPSSPVACTSA
jgi:hypothetical protein